MTQASIKEQRIELAILNNPVLWAEKNFAWVARDYQVAPLQSIKNSRQTVLRFGRRLGKSEIIDIAVLWHAFCQPNKIHQDKYNILILCPYDAQVDLHFDRLHELLNRSPALQKSITRDVHHRIELSNGTVITGMTVGSKNASGADNTRGQRADLIILDESDFMGEKEITNILNLRNESPETIRIIAASTPCGKRGSYYRWCTQASLFYEALVDAINVSYKVKFIKKAKPKGEGNGWTAFYAPSTVNKELLKINPDTGQSYIDDFRDELTEERFEQEVMALFGVESLGVFNKDYLDYAFAAGKYQKYYNRMAIDERAEWKRRHVLHKKVFGVDWDKAGAGPSLVGVMFDETDFKFKVFLRIELPRTEFTYINAVNEVIKWNNEIDPDWIYIDRGAGDVQAEMLAKYGRQYPESGLQKKVIANSLAEKTNIIDIFTKKRVKHPLKPTMINNAVLVFERKSILIPEDKKLRTQLEEYRIKRITQAGVPVYEDGNDHFVDALARALFGFAKQYDELFKVTVSTKVKYINGVDVSQSRPTLSGGKKDKENNDIAAHNEFIMREVFKHAEHNPFDPEYAEEKATGTFGRGTAFGSSPGEGNRPNRGLVNNKSPKRRSWRK